MHKTNPHRWLHSHNYLPDGHRRGERQTLRVIALTSVMMVAEIVAGSVLNSMALLDPKTADHYRKVATDALALSHVAVEVNRCPGPGPD
ncbi:MAG: hypothetical protein JRE45_20370 [Deltaproteobacteria bacterium]|jgi:Co/Zn/Cd efflux system component|nr:hypothetical protein [Deltaproteobacteria bacterium]